MPLLTDMMLRKTKAPPSGRIELWDSKVTGLAWRITASGARSWSIFYRAPGQKRRLTLGAYRPEGAALDGLTLAEARSRARAILRDVADGGDPQGEKAHARAEAKRAGSTVADLARLWLAAGRVTKGARKGQPWRPKTYTEFVRLIEEEVVPVLGDLSPAAVTKAHLRALYDGIEHRSLTVAQHVLAVVRMLFAWASEEDHVDAMPTFPKRGTQSAKRDRVLEEPELRAVLAALDAGIGEGGRQCRVEVMAEALKLMLFTGQRRGEVLSMAWADVTEERDGAWWTIPAERHKAGKEHRVPLTAPAVEALKRLHGLTGSGRYVFPAPKAGAKVPWVGNPQKAAGRLWAASSVQGATVHDLRRSCATYMVRMGVPRLVVSKVLGHADSDVTGRYDKHAYDVEKRGALARWSDELLRIVAATEEKGEAKVLPWAR